MAQLTLKTRMALFTSATLPAPCTPSPPAAMLSFVRSSHLEGQSTLTTQNGSVRLTAALDPTGTYHLETTSGDIDLTLPATSAFQLDAHTTSGSVRNAFNNDQVGTTPRAQVTASVMNGSVIVDMSS